MSLATRCSSCGTAFRVVQDQLNVSEGWVRCGRCSVVFNAVEQLFDLDSADAIRRETGFAGPFVTPSASPSSPSSSPPVDVDLAAPHDDPAAAVRRDGAALRRDADPSRRDDGADGHDAPGIETLADAPAADAPSDTPHFEPSSLDALLADPTDARLFRKRRQRDDRTPAVQVDKRDRLEFSDARFDSDLFEDALEPEADAAESAEAAIGAPPLEGGGTAQPDFLRRADRRARWRSRPVRAALFTGATLATVALVLQAGHHFRDAIAAQQPALRLALEAWCDIASCSIEAPRRVDVWAVESTGLSRAIGIDAYQLAVTLRNRAPHAVAVPWIDLSLTDANGRLVSRRALAPADFGVARASPAGAELQLQLAFDAGSNRIAGYTVEIFQP